MDGRNTYGRVLKMIENWPDEMHLDEIKNRIRVYIGAHDQTVITTLRLMMQMQIIKEDSSRPFIYFINKNGIPTL